MTTLECRKSERRNPEKFCLFLFFLNLEEAFTLLFFKNEIFVNKIGEKECVFVVLFFCFCFFNFVFTDRKVVRS